MFVGIVSSQSGNALRVGGRPETRIDVLLKPLTLTLDVFKTTMNKASGEAYYPQLILECVVLSLKLLGSR